MIISIYSYDNFHMIRGHGGKVIIEKIMTSAIRKLIIVDKIIARLSQFISMIAINFRIRSNTNFTILL